MTEDRNPTEKLLNEHQHSALSIRLALLDRQLYEAEKLIAGELPRGAMFETSSNLTAEEREKLRALFAQARNLIQMLRDRFALDGHREDVRRWLLGHFSVLWSTLQDSRAPKLKGFGEISPELAAQLDPEIDQLIEIVSRIKSLVSSARD